MINFRIRHKTILDQEWVRKHTRQYWGDEMVVAHGVIYYPAELPGFIAESTNNPIGLATYSISGEECELVSIETDITGNGIGKALVQAVKQKALEVGCQRLWLVTTNDNLEALGFYQKIGFHLVAVHRDAINEARKVKPSIPLLGEHGIPLRDEIELEMGL
jgi:N-acetylglutamate synthase-like GNAT family acetyltransferase